MRSNRGASGSTIFATVGLLFLLLVLYFLFTGPATWLAWNGYLSAEDVQAFYAPLIWLGESCEPFKDFLTWYDSFFTPDLSDLPIIEK